MKITTLGATLALALVSSACGKDDSNNNNNQSSSKTVKGNIIYTGAATGSLIVSITTNAAPTCPADQPEQYKMINAPAFPYAYTFTNLEGGAYYVYGFFDVGGNAGFPPCPQADDLCGKNTTPVEVTDANPTANLDVTLDIVGCVQ